MAVDFGVKVGSTGNLLNAVLEDGAGLPIPLNSGIDNVKLYMRSLDSDVNKVNGATCTIRDDGTEPLKGSVEYAWAAGDIDTAGVYNAEFKITFSNGKVIRVPEEPKNEDESPRYFRIAVGLALG